MKSIYNKIVRNQPTNSSVNDLTNVSTNNLQNRDVFIFNGSNWTNSRVDYSEITNTPPSPSTLDSLTDVVITTPTTNSFLRYNGTNWVNTYPLDYYGSVVEHLLSTFITPQYDVMYYTSSGHFNMPTTVIVGKTIKINVSAGHPCTIRFTGTALFHLARIIDAEIINQVTESYIEFIGHFNNGAPGWLIRTVTGRWLLTNNNTIINPNNLGLNDARDTGIINPSINQILRWDGSARWINSNESVTSVFGRTGSVVATSGDYSLSQIGGVSLNTPTTGNVLKYDGSNFANSFVDDTTFQRITVSAQTITGALNTLYYCDLATINLPAPEVNKCIKIIVKEGVETNINLNGNILVHIESFLNANLRTSDAAYLELNYYINSHWIVSKMSGRWLNTTNNKYLTYSNGNLEDLRNTSISGPTSGEILSYNGSVWTNISPSRCLPTAEIYQNGDGTTDTETLTTLNTWYIFNSATTFNANPTGSAVFNSPSNGAIRYIGPSGKYFHVAVSLSLSTNTSANSYEVAIFRNGAIEPGSIFSIDFANNNVNTSTAFHKIIAANINDIFELKMRNISASGSIITYNNINVVFMSCCD